ncbi:hypothetical protein ILUMI_03113 [Ignelater luminosus]|uniref:PiggyBac transposable element-derived protein domain-containing protein n=1 Tax=Ignelater luminosus TaxID=2038154 RepID=A0A8K0DF76_IGNLU|nr:hypothetical protein ILUMI_03113 [Ignelater luminosus]
MGPEDPIVVFTEGVTHLDGNSSVEIKESVTVNSDVAENGPISEHDTESEQDWRHREIKQIVSMLLLPDSAVEEIVDFTNKKIATARGKYKRFKRSRSSRTLLTHTSVKDTDLLEIKPFLGLLYLQGIYKSGHEDMRSLWATKGRGRPIFRVTMSLARFSFLPACFRFNNLDNGTERAISEIFQKFVENCKACYCPGTYVTVDEMLIPFRGRCSFKAKIYAGAEVGNKNKEDLKLANPTQVVLRFAAPIFGTNRNITVDNWYSSVELVEELRKYNITHAGTLKKIKELMHHDASVNEDSQKPEIIHLYNDTKFGVDSLDAKCPLYSVQKRCRRWPIAVFFAVLNIAGVNGRVLYQCSANAQDNIAINTKKSQEKIIHHNNKSVILLEAPQFSFQATVQVFFSVFAKQLLQGSFCNDVISMTDALNLT